MITLSGKNVKYITANESRVYIVTNNNIISYYDCYPTKNNSLFSFSQLTSRTTTNSQNKNTIDLSKCIGLKLYNKNINGNTHYGQAMAIDTALSNADSDRFYIACENLASSNPKISVNVMQQDADNWKTFTWQGSDISDYYKTECSIYFQNVDKDRKKLKFVFVRGSKIIEDIIDCSDSRHNVDIRRLSYLKHTGDEFWMDYVKTI